MSKIGDSLDPAHPLYPIRAEILAMMEKSKAPFIILTQGENNSGIFISIRSPACGCSVHKFEFIEAMTEGMIAFHKELTFELGPKIAKEILDELTSSLSAEPKDGQAPVSSKDPHLASFLFSKPVDTDGK